MRSTSTARARLCTMQSPTPARPPIRSHVRARAPTPAFHASLPTPRTSCACAPHPSGLHTPPSHTAHTLRGAHVMCVRTTPLPHAHYTARLPRSLAPSTRCSIRRGTAGLRLSLALHLRRLLIHRSILPTIASHHLRRLRPLHTQPSCRLLGVGAPMHHKPMCSMRCHSIPSTLTAALNTTPTARLAARERHIPRAQCNASPSVPGFCTANSIGSLRCPPSS
ncbi:hypothetical protein B0H19DRAFT_478898 [Mycena capillaripes]|nr:hypothetical protein B0H19DRAFT_537173 [Mycena capillaripes]KAJ6530709.1 hypothetical protein B0H19DRAFT_478898 [Mycena capillaripes]